MKLPETDIRSPYQSEAWIHVRALFPATPELERLARETGALRRRRGVEAAEELLRVLLCYAVCALSLRHVCDWAKHSGLARFTKTALVRHLHKATPWLERLLEVVLNQQAPPRRVAGLRVVVVDGTRICPPGSRGRGWCCHTAQDPWTGRTLQVELTDNKGAERLERYRLGPDDLVIADAGHAHRAGLASVVARGASYLVRTNWCNLPFETRHGREFPLFERLESLPELGTADFEVRIKADLERNIPALDCRLVVWRKPRAAAEAACKKAKAEARRRKSRVDERTVKACHFVLLVTNVAPEKLGVERLLGLYRVRWQIELGFKRWKSLLDVDEVRSREPHSVRAALTAKLLGAVIVETLA